MLIQVSCFNLDEFFFIFLSLFWRVFIIILDRAVQNDIQQMAQDRLEPEDLQ